MSSPSYKTRVAHDVQSKMRGWALTREERNSMWTRLLTELPSAPDRFLYEAIQRPNLWAYRFSLGQSPQRHFLSFAVERRDYAGELYVVAASIVAEGEGEQRG